jgi:beta-1,4-mannosyltransferase
MAVSPTSWTADEDFGLLIEAVTACETLIHAQEGADRPFPELLILLTGRGPLRQHYESRVASRKAARIHLRTMWLEPGEYPKVLAAADLGLCLHRSTSGLDLPMKVADMFGVGIPVCALNYGPCLSEIVRHGTNGLLFSTAPELARQLHELFKASPTDERQLTSLGRGVSAAQSERWQAAWTCDVWPAVSSLSRV